MIYLDNNATTQVDPEVVAAMQPYFYERFANPSSIHEFGSQIRLKIEEVRLQIAKKIGCGGEEIFFTSSGSESNNFCLKGFALANREKGNHIITTAIEHPSVLNSCSFLETQGFEVTYLEVDAEGFVNPHTLKEAINARTILISIAHVNNEIGTIQPIETLVKVSNGIAFHTDAVQSFLKTDFNISNLNINLASFSGHKFHAPKGIGFVYKRKDTKACSVIHGGHQEMNLRSGTENVPYIIALGKAIETISPYDIGQMKILQKFLIEELLRIPGVKLNGPANLDQRICSNVNISYDCLEGEYILHELSKFGYCVSTGSACQSSHSRISPVLQGIKCPPRFIHGNIRIGLSKFTTKSHLEGFLEKLSYIISNKSPFKLYVCK